MLYVFDISFVCPQIIPDEKDPQLDKIYREIKHEDEKHAPHLFWYEIINVFKNLLRRKRYSYDEVIDFYEPLAAIRLTFDREEGVEYSKKILRLCNDYNLSSYDATYLELADRKGAVLCTLDEGLRTAAKKYGVKVIK